MISEIAGTAWLDIAYHEWLFGCDYSSNLREPTRKVVEQMQQAVERNNNAIAESLMNMLRGLSSRFTQDPSGSTRTHSYEMAETLVECGRVTYGMNEKLTALQYFEESAQKYKGHDHCQAAALWMLGCIQWQYSTKIQEAIVSWETSLELFKRLEERSNRAELTSWYQFWSEEMRSALSTAMAGGERMPPVKRPSWPRSKGRGESAGHQEAAPPPTSPPPPGRTGRTSRRSDVLRSFAVYSSIPAGGFASSPQPQTYVELEYVCIDGVDHYVLNLYHGKTVNLLDIEHYVVVRVTGDSMNLKGIEDGDYVLLRVQEVADSGDIVAVEIDRHLPGDEKSTLKQFIRKEGKIILRPQSSNPNHPTYEFTEKNRDFHICGVAIAILKRQVN